MKQGDCHTRNRADYRRLHRPCPLQRTVRPLRSRARHRECRVQGGRRRSPLPRRFPAQPNRDAGTGLDRKPVGQPIRDPDGFGHRVQNPRGHGPRLRLRCGRTRPLRRCRLPQIGVIRQGKHRRLRPDFHTSRGRWIFRAMWLTVRRGSPRALPRQEIGGITTRVLGRDPVDQGILFRHNRVAGDRGTWIGQARPDPVA